MGKERIRGRRRENCSTNLLFPWEGSILRGNQTFGTGGGAGIS